VTPFKLFHSILLSNPTTRTPFTCVFLLSHACMLYAIVTVASARAIKMHNCSPPYDERKMRLGTKFAFAFLVKNVSEN
jgi:hypothetical protein